MKKEPCCLQTAKSGSSYVASHRMLVVHDTVWSTLDTSVKVQKNTGAPHSSITIITVITTVKVFPSGWRNKSQIGVLTCNDFYLSGPWHENVWDPLLYILFIACHNLAFMFKWHYQNAHMTAHQLWIPARHHWKTFCTFHPLWHDLSLWSSVHLRDVPSCATSFFFLVKFIALSSACPSQGKSQWGGCFVIEACECSWFIGSWQGREFWRQSETHIVIKSIKFLSL